MAPASSHETGPRSAFLDPAISLALAVVTAAAFAAVGGHGYVNYDDPLYVTQNAMVQRGLNAESVRWAFTTLHAANYHPLTWLSILLDVQLFGLDARGHHLMGLALHALNTVLFYQVSLRMTGARWPSAFAAALFGWHPLRVEAVAWISQRKDVLSMLFALLGLLAYQRYARRPRWSTMLAVALALLAGLLAKPVLVTFPFALLLLDRWPLRRIESPAWLAIEPAGTPFARASFGALVREKSALFGLVLLSSVVTWLVQRGGGAMDAMVPALARVLNAFTSYVRYVWKTVWPTKLSVHYAYPSNIDLVSPLIAGGMLAWVTWLAWRERDRLPFLLTGWLFFLGTLVPMIGLVQVGSQAMADRYTYVAGIGLFWILAFGAQRAFDAWHVPAPARAVAALGVLAAAFFATRTQVGYWKDSVTLFSRAVALDSTNHVARGNLAAELIEREDLEGARAQLEAATKIRPETPDHWINLGAIAAKQGRKEEALRLYGAALDLDPGSLSACLNYGLAALDLGRPDDAIPKLERVVAGQAGRNLQKLVIAHRALAAAYRAKGRSEDAAAQLRAAQALEATGAG